MDIKTYLTPLLRWWWLLLAASLVAAISSFLVTLRQPPIYQTRTTMIIGRTVYEPNPTTGDLYLGQQLASYYADLARRDPVRNATMSALGLQWLPDYNAYPLPNSQLIEIAVTDISPVRAQAVANEIARQLILQSPASPEQQDQERQAFINEQLNQLEANIKDTRDEIDEKQQSLGELVSARQIADLQTEIQVLQTKLTTLQSNYAALLANTQRGASNVLTVLEPANLPVVPIGPQKTTMVLLSTVIGFTIAAGAAYLLEYMDDTIRSPEEANRLLNVPVLGYIGEMHDEGIGAYVAKNPRSMITDAFRSLRTNLEFAGVEAPLRTIYVSSPGVTEGKTSLAINLATVIAQGGKKVILVDADLRKPSIHEYLGLPNEKGLSDVFMGDVDIFEVATHWKDGNITVVTAGEPPPNPAELLGSRRMNKILDDMEELADVVIIDGPPFLVADAAVLACKVDGVLLTIRYGYTRRPMALAMNEQLKRAGARVLGVALNRTPRKHLLYPGYSYYSSYYHVESEDGKERAASNGRFNLPWALKGIKKEAKPVAPVKNPAKAKK